MQYKTNVIFTCTIFSNRNPKFEKGGGGTSNRLATSTTRQLAAMLETSVAKRNCMDLPTPSSTLTWNCARCANQLLCSALQRAIHSLPNNLQRRIAHNNYSSVAKSFKSAEASGLQACWSCPWHLSTVPPVDLSTVKLITDNWQLQLKTENWKLNDSTSP